MKRKSMFARFLSVAVGALALVGLTGTVAHAVLIAGDGMDYPVGTVTTAGGVGWTNGFTWSSTITAYANAGGLSYLTLPTSGSVAVSRTAANPFDGPERLIDTSPASAAAVAGLVDGNGNIGADGTTVWVSACLSLPQGNGHYFNLALYREDKAAMWRPTQQSASWQKGTFIVNNGNGNTGIATDQPLFVVSRIDFKSGSDDIRTWANPTSIASEVAMGTPTHTWTGGVDASFNGVKLYSNAEPSDNFLRMDEIRVGTTFADVTGPIAPPSSTPGTLIYGK